MRGSLGCNNNPTAVQFISSYKKLLLGGKGDINVDTFNMILEDDVQIVDLFQTIEKIKCEPKTDFDFDLGLSRCTLEITIITGLCIFKNKQNFQTTFFWD